MASLHMGPGGPPSQGTGCVGAGSMEASDQGHSMSVPHQAGPWVTHDFPRESCVGEGGCVVRV